MITFSTWPSAIGWLCARFSVAMVAPFGASRQCSTRSKCSPITCSPESGSRRWISGTRPASEFSQGSMASVAAPSRTACIAASKDGQGSVVQPG